MFTAEQLDNAEPRGLRKGRSARIFAELDAFYLRGSTLSAIAVDVAAYMAQAKDGDCQELYAAIEALLAERRDVALRSTVFR